MCNEVARRIALGQLCEDWSELKVPLVFPEGLPNLGQQDGIRITDTALIPRAYESGVTGTMRRWSWPGCRRRRSSGLRPPAAWSSNPPDRRSEPIR